MLLLSCDESIIEKLRYYFASGLLVTIATGTRIRRAGILLCHHLSP